MITKPILIVAGEPYSVFLEIYFKSLKKKKNKRFKKSYYFNLFKRFIIKTNEKIEI